MAIWGTGSVTIVDPSVRSNLLDNLGETYSATIRLGLPVLYM